MQGILGRPAVHLLLLALVAFAAYANSFHGELVFDDLSSIVDNPAIKNLSAFLSGAGYAYNPRRFIGYLSFALNYKLGGLAVTGYHAVNLTIHIINAWLVYDLVRLTLRTPFFECRTEDRGPRTENAFNLGPRFSNLVPLFTALLFVAHPVQTQAVAYIVQRVASLVTMFYLLSLVLYVRARLTQERTGRLLSPGAAAMYFLSLASAVLAMQTKELAVTLPLVVVLYEFSFFGAGLRKKLVFLAPLLLTMLILPLGLLNTGKPLGELLSDVNEITRKSLEISRGDYLLTQFSVIVTYIRLIFFPINQNLDYDYPIYHSLFTPRVFLSFLFLLFLFGLAVWLYYRSYQCKVQSAKCKVQDGNEKKDSSLCTLRFAPFTPGAMRLAAFGILWFFITLSVESSVIPFPDVIFEHRLYLPSIGAFLAISAATEIFTGRVGLRVLTACAAVVVLALATATWQRNLVWRDALVLWQDVIAKSPEKGRAHNELGKVLFERGRTDEAIEQYQRALSLDPAIAFVHVNLGAAYHRKGELDQAIQEYNAALSMKTKDAKLHNNLGAAYYEKGLLDKASAEYQIVLQQQPNDAMAHINLGMIHHKKGELDQAIREYQTALQSDPDSATAHNAMGRAYVQALQLDKAVEQFNAAIALDPTDTDSKYRRDKVLVLMDMMKKGQPAGP